MQRNRILKMSLTFFIFCTILQIDIKAEQINIIKECHSSNACVFTSINTVAQNSLGDSVAAVILEADKITAKVEALEDENLVEKDVECRWSQLVKYTFCQPSMYKSDKMVFGIFSPFAYLTFIKGETSVTIVFDYGLNKWAIENPDGSIVGRRDMPDGELLPLFYMLFPESELIKMSYQNLIERCKESE